MKLKAVSVNEQVVKLLSEPPIFRRVWWLLAGVMCFGTVLCSRVIHFESSCCFHLQDEASISVWTIKYVELQYGFVVSADCKGCGR